MHIKRTNIQTHVHMWHKYYTHTCHTQRRIIRTDMHVHTRIHKLHTYRELYAHILDTSTHTWRTHAHTLTLTHSHSHTHFLRAGWYREEEIQQHPGNIPHHIQAGGHRGFLSRGEVEVRLWLLSCDTDLCRRIVELKHKLILTRLTIVIAARTPHPNHIPAPH